MDIPLTAGESSSSGSRRRSRSSPGVTHSKTLPFRSTAPPGAYHDPPSPRTTLAGLSTDSIPVQGSTTMLDSPPLAGPSSEGALARKASEDDPRSTISPSSAPAVPSVIAVAHPSLYIHTQHPRRGSMTPLGLHVISPVPPNPNNPIRSVGFSPSYQPYALSQTTLAPHSEPLDPLAAARRGSSASTCSTLTQSRPNSVLPPGFNRERRRSSLTPSIPTLAPPSPTRAHAAGRNHSRPISSDGSNPPPMHARTRTAENAPRQLLAGGSPLAAAETRRGSLPQLNYGAWNGPTAKTWNPSLPPPRSSLIEEGQLPDEGYRFGSGAPPTGASAAAAALKNLELSPTGRKNSLHPKSGTDPFAETEAEEAERQHRAFLAATYGHDGKRARERLSFAGPHGMLGAVASPAMPGNNLRRQSLMLWEKINTAAAAARSFDAPATASEPSVSTLLSPRSLEELAPRRGSLPVAIPGNGLGRAPSRRVRGFQETDDAQPDSMTSDLDLEVEADLDPEGLDDAGSEEDPNSLRAPQRPLPPLLPLSDPGPRLLPSTLALHRANHLLHSRNLQADPLPHPLPPSLHPPAPVDLAEFDIDFILAGSQAQLGGSRKSSNAPVDVLQTKPHAVNATPTLKLGGGDDEDTFAKFVGEFDDEYGGRRGEWTFRACPPRAFSATIIPARQPKAEWDSLGAGRYELYSDGDVKSLQTGSVWKVRRSGSREYELEEKQHEQSEIAPFSDPSSSTSGFNGTDCFALASKCAHIESGGIQLPLRHRSGIALPLAPSDPQLRVSISDQLGLPERTQRLGSADSASTARAFSSSLPLVSVLTPKKNRQASRGEHDSPRDGSLVPPPQRGERGRASESAASGRTLSSDKRKEKRGDSRDRDEEKKKGGFGGAIKRALKSTLTAGEEKRAIREEREREKMQSQSWSPSLAKPKDYIHPSGKGFADKQSRGQVKTAPPALIERLSRSSSNTSDASRPPPSAYLNPVSAADRPRLSPRGSSGGNIAVYREGKGWKGVPDEAVAMVIPLADEDTVTTPETIPSITSRSVEGSKLALLVWFVPFNSDSDDRPQTATSSASSRHGSEPIGVVSPPSKSVEPSSSGSLPKFQKLLRRRASKDKEALKRDQRDLRERLAGSAQSSDAQLGVSGALVESKLSCAVNPLPFRSFRVVARVVDLDEVRSDNMAYPGPAASFSPTTASRTTSARAPSSLGSGQSPSYNALSLPSTDENEVSSVSTAPTSTILAGRTFPTVIAVCHSRSSGVEFVLEGLDRLGFCEGESAWGPTGYEEWRGNGLSEKGRQLVDLLWAGCVGVMGLVGSS